MIDLTLSTRSAILIGVAIGLVLGALLMTHPITAYVVMLPPPCEVSYDEDELTDEEPIRIARERATTALRARGFSESYATYLGSILGDKALEHQIPEYIPTLAAQLWVESRGGTRARSKVGAVGLMQIRPEIWGDTTHCEGDLYDPVVNITCGVHVFAHYLSECDGNSVCALNRYSGYAHYAHNPSPYVEKVHALN